MQRNPFALFQQFPELTVELWAKDDRINVKQDLASALGKRDIAIPKQVHGNRTIVARSPMLFSENADGVLTDQLGLTLSVLMADCQTFAVYAPKKRVAGVLHAGWRGLIAGAIPAFFEMLRQEWNILPSECFVAAGPSLCASCSEFTDPHRELPDIDPKFFHGRLVDLRGIADDQMDHLGIPLSQRERHLDCTRCKHDQYWSYRGPDRERVREGWENVLCVKVRPTTVEQ